MSVIENRYEFVAIFDVENGNPNGDPDAGNMPRVDPETAYGIVTDVCLKRKIRNYVEMCKEGEEGYNILIKNDKALNTKFTEAHDALGLPKGKGTKAKPEDIKTARDYMCKNYFDVRAFGAVMNTGNNWCGTVCGSVQMNFARSVEPVYTQDLTITRQAKVNEDDAETGMGKKSIIPYGLYKVEGYVSANLAQKVTGFSEEDLELLWDAIINMFEYDHSAARGKMCMRKFIVFKHDSIIGNAPSHKLFEKISINKKQGVAFARSYKDYEVTIDTNMPSGVTMIEKL